MTTYCFEGSKWRKKLLAREISGELKAASAFSIIGLCAKNKETAKKNLTLVLFLVDENLWHRVSKLVNKFQQQLLNIDRILTLWKFWVNNDEDYSPLFVTQKRWDAISRANNLLQGIKSVIQKLDLTERQKADFEARWLDVYNALEDSRYFENT